MSCSATAIRFIRICSTKIHKKKMNCRTLTKHHCDITTSHNPLQSPFNFYASTSIFSPNLNFPPQNSINFPPNPIPKTPKSLKLSISASYSSKSAVPSRDRIIDFGKYKGKMLGTLPSIYLKWVSKNLRAGDYEEWARRVDEVLEDPIYKDRIEWEFAEKILNGAGSRSNYSSNSGFGVGENGGSVAELLEISKRFGWNNEDKLGWGKIDFGLLGTSKGGRIPRLGDESTKRLEKKVEYKKKVGSSDQKNGNGNGGGEKRRERRERLKLRKMENNSNGGGDSSNRSRIIGSSTEGICDDADDVVVNNANQRAETTRSPFPGRQSLLKKVIMQKKIMK